MKKLIVLLLALVMVGAVSAQAAAPAPALAFSGYLNTGFQYDTTSGDLYLFNADAGNSTRVRWNMAYTNGDYGVNFRIQNSDVAGAGAAQLFTQALVWGNMFDKMVTVKVGKLNDYTWATPYYAYGNFDGKTGVQFQVKPVAALNAGIWLPLGIKGTSSVDLVDVFKDMGVAAKYTVDGLGTFLAHLDLGAAATALYASANITAVENLTAIVEAKLGNLAALGTTTTINEYFSYSVSDALSVGVFAQEAFGASLVITVAPEVAYVMGNTELGASVTYATDGSYSVDPYATFTLNAKSKVDVYAGYDGAFTAGANFRFNF